MRLLTFLIVAMLVATFTTIYVVKTSVDNIRLDLNKSTNKAIKLARKNDEKRASDTGTLLDILQKIDTQTKISNERLKGAGFLIQKEKYNEITGEYNK